MENNDLGRAPAGQALVSDQAASRLDPPGFDPSRGPVECEPMHPNEDGWSDWVHPLPGYLMQCCGCSLVHEAQFAIADGVVIFRMRRHGEYGGEMAYWNGVAQNLGFASVCEAMESLSQKLGKNTPPLTGSGWVYWNPDAGEEYAPQHPINSGECADAENIRPSTPQEDTLWEAFQEQFQRNLAASAIEARRAETQSGSVHESAVGSAETPNLSDSQGQTNDQG